MYFWFIAQWDNSSRYKHYFRKSLESNFIRSEIYINENIFWSVEQKIIVLTLLYFIGFFFFLKKNIFCNVHTKRVHETYCCWRYVLILFQILLILYHWIHLILVRTEFLWIYVPLISFSWINKLVWYSLSRCMELYKVWKFS